MKIVSLLPSATEIAFILGLGDSLVGVTHECDYPPVARSLPVLTKSLIPHCLRSSEIDAAVSKSRRDAHTLYALDTDRLASLAPDFVLTQSLCEVCAVPRSVIDEMVCTMPRSATVLSLDPSSLWDLLQDIRRVGDATNHADEAKRIVSQLQVRIERVRETVGHASERPRVFCAEWLDPIFCAGHWLPEMVSIAGGEEGLGRPEVDSVRIPWESVREYQPEVIFLMPCGFDSVGALREASAMTVREGWDQLPAVRDGRVFVVDANSYFARPGPRLIDGLEILARLIHPEIFTTTLLPEPSLRLIPGTVDCFEAYL